MIINANYVYVLLAGMEMTVTDGLFSTVLRSKISGWSNVLTMFLNSLAKSRHPGVAVILSGLDAGGAEALKAFHEHGGVTIVQDLKTTERGDMPLAAIPFQPFHSDSRHCPVFRLTHLADVGGLTRHVRAQSPKPPCPFNALMYPQGICG
jgi:hypothetical protein